MPFCLPKLILAELFLILEFFRGFFFHIYEHISSFLVTHKDKPERQEKPEKKERHAGNDLMSALILHFEVPQD